MMSIRNNSLPPAEDARRRTKIVGVRARRRLRPSLPQPGERGQQHASRHAHIRPSGSNDDGYGPPDRPPECVDHVEDGVARAGA